MSTEDDPAALRERVREQHDRIERLEQTVADLQDSDGGSAATSTRRSILASAAAAAGLGGLGYGVGQAQAQASGPAGQQGTASAPNDMYAWDLDVQGQVTRDIDFGGYGVTNGGSFDIEVATIEQLAARLSFGADGYLRGLDESNSPWIEGNKRTLSDTETTDLSQTGEQGTDFGSMAFVFDRSNDQGGVFLTNVETVEQVDGNSHFSTTGGNGGTLNVIWDSGDTTLKLENQTGDIAGVNWWLFGGGT